MTERIQKGGLQIEKILFDLIENDVIPGTGVDPEAYWASFDEIVHELGPKNKALLQKRDKIQAQVDAWHLARKGQSVDAR